MNKIGKILLEMREKSGKNFWKTEKKRMVRVPLSTVLLFYNCNHFVSDPFYELTKHFIAMLLLHFQKLFWEWWTLLLLLSCFHGFQKENILQRSEGNLENGNNEISDECILRNWIFLRCLNNCKNQIFHTKNTAGSNDTKNEKELKSLVNISV